jgi:hypothetical protein
MKARRSVAFLAECTCASPRAHCRVTGGWIYIHLFAPE